MNSIQSRLFNFFNHFLLALSYLIYEVAVFGEFILEQFSKRIKLEKGAFGMAQSAFKA
jgi:hypothetical protein